MQVRLAPRREAEPEEARLAQMGDMDEGRRVRAAHIEPVGGAPGPDHAEIEQEFLRPVQIRRLQPGESDIRNLDHARTSLGRAPAGMSGGPIPTIWPRSAAGKGAARKARTAIRGPEPRDPVLGPAGKPPDTSPSSEGEVGARERAGWGCCNARHAAGSSPGAVPVGRERHPHPLRFAPRLPPLKRGKDSIHGVNRLTQGRAERHARTTRTNDTHERHARTTRRGFPVLRQTHRSPAAPAAIRGPDPRRAIAPVDPGRRIGVQGDGKARRPLLLASLDLYVSINIFM